MAQKITTTTIHKVVAMDTGKMEVLIRKVSVSDDSKDPEEGDEQYMVVLYSKSDALSGIELDMLPEDFMDFMEDEGMDASDND